MEEAAATEELTSKEAAALAGVSRRSINAWLAAGHIKAVARLDGRRILRSSLLAYLARRAGHADAAATPEADAEDEPAGAAPPNLIVGLLLTELAAEREAARAERETLRAAYAAEMETLRRENRDLAIQLGKAQGQAITLLLSGAAAGRAATAAAREADPPRLPWWRKLFRGGSQ